MEKKSTKSIIDIIVPLYNAENYIVNLHKSFLMQKNVVINKIKYILTESNDNTEEILRKNKYNYKKITKEEYSHSMTRESEAFNSKADIVVFVTQDVQIEDDKWLYYLTKDLNDEIICAYSRQISKYNNIEKYTREKNYPEKSKVVSKKDINNLGLKTFFCSDASCALNRKKFVLLNGYDNKKLPTNEDMYYAYKVIMNDYKIKYCAKSVVYHSHQFTLKQIYERYKLTGQFFKENDYLNNYKTLDAGASLAKYIFKRIIAEKKFALLFRYPFDMAARLIGMKVGKRSKK